MKTQNGKSQQKTIQTLLFRPGDLVYYKFGYRNNGPFPITHYRRNEFSYAIIISVDKNIELAEIYILDGFTTFTMGANKGPFRISWKFLEKIYKE